MGPEALESTRLPNANVADAHAQEASAVPRGNAEPQPTTTWWGFFNNLRLYV
jgi:hypothetical protein